MRTFKTYSALQSHIKRNHSKSDLPDASLFGCHDEPLLSMIPENHDGFFSTDPEDPMNGGLEDVGGCGDVESMDESGPCETGSLQTAAARFLLALKEQHRLTQVSINFLVDQVKLIVAGVVAGVEEAIRSKLSSEGVTTIIDECFRDVNPFEGLETEYKQSKFYKEHFNLVVRY